MQQLDAAGATQRLSVVTNERYGRLISEQTPAGSEFHLFDPIGSTRKLADDTGSVTDTFRFRAFGEELSHSGTSESPYTFVGRLGYNYDSDTGLYLARSRWLDPATGTDAVTQLIVNRGEVDVRQVAISTLTGGFIGKVTGGANPQQGSFRGLARSVRQPRPAPRASSRAGLLTRIRRFFYDNRDFHRTIGPDYWSARGAANGRSLHHWLFPQRTRWVPQGIRNAGFNLVQLPPLRGVFHRSLDLNRWMGFARNWGRPHARRAAIVENAIRLGIPAASAGTAYAGYQLGDALASEFFDDP